MQDDPQPLTEEELETAEPDDTRIRIAKSQVFSVRLSAGELRKIAEEARLLGMTAGTFIKRAAMDAAETHRYSGPATAHIALTGTAFAIQYDVAATAAVTVDVPGGRSLRPAPAAQVA